MIDHTAKIDRLKQIAFEIHGFVAANAEDHKPEIELPPPPGYQENKHAVSEIDLEAGVPQEHQG